MDTKLTLKLDKSVIERAKKYASNHKTSLSKMVENYLNTITSNKKTKPEITPLVESLSGVIKVEHDFDYKKNYAKHLAKKYK